VWLFDADGGTKRMNERMMQILSITAKDVAANSLATFLDQDERARIDAAAAAGAITVSFAEHQFRRQDGTAGCAAIEFSILGDERSRYEGLLALVVDISERNSPQESEAFYRTLFERSPLAKLVVDAETLRFTAVNEGALRTYGYSRDELLAMNADQLLVRERVATRELATRRTSEFSGRCQHLTKGGQKIWVEMTAHPTTIGHRRCWLVVAKDVSEQQLLEEQLRHSAKMEAVGRLASGIAHDFNNALSVVLSYSEELLARLGAEDPIREDIAEIHRAGQRSAALTRQLLAFTRQQVLEPRVVNLSEIVGGMNKMLRRLIGEDIELTVCTPPDVGAVRVDVGSIEQVVMNLVVNARDAMPRGGRLRLETANVCLDDTSARRHSVSAGAYVTLTVGDNGCGMDAATRARAFEPFFTTKDRGTGLGLASVLGIVEQSGGSISLHSEVGAGTTFEIFLPRLDAAVASGRPPPPTHSVDGTDTVLVVEDDAAVREVVCRILAAHHYRVLAAASGAEALRIAAETRVDVLLTDVVMPQMSGPELATRVAMLWPHVAIVCMSGYADDSVVRHGLFDRQFVFVHKPVTPKPLTQKIREALASKLFHNVS
jgi:two-component system, cell cycle sensor histidine kinase and response regulator CckA